MRRITFSLIVFCLLSLSLFSARANVQFCKSITYYLIDDIPMARKYINLYFDSLPDPILKNAFSLLFRKKNWDATRQFNNYLNLKHRSNYAIVGIALATADMKDSTSMDNLKKAIRLNPAFSPAYLCLGFEYMKQKKYPQAEKNLNLAFRNSRIPDYKIILSHLYLKLKEPKIVVDLVKREAERHPDNFHFNFLTATALFQLNKFKEMQYFIEASIENKPDNNEAKLLWSKYLLNQNELKRAKSILSRLKFREYNENYVKTMASVLLKLKDNNAKSYLYEFFSGNQWDQDINRLMGTYHLNKKKTGNVQNWIIRSILSGNKIDKLKEVFTDKYRFSSYKYVSFFEVKKIKWISGKALLVAGNLKSGGAERLYVVDPQKMRIKRTIQYRGVLQDIFLSKDHTKVIISTSPVLNEKIYLYTLDISANRFRLTPVLGYALRMPLPLVGFNKSCTLVYITDSTISSLAFDSPFSKVSQYGKKTSVYPSYPFPVYQYNFKTKAFTRIKNLARLRNVKIDAVQKYFLVADVYQSNSKIKRLIEKGQRLDLTSSELVKIHFSKDLTSFIIYLSDLKNAFQAIAYHNFDDKSVRFDETMFLGKGRYAELEILDFFPRKKEIFVLTKGKNKDLIRFNYGSFLSDRLTRKTLSYCFDQNQNMIYVLTEKSKKMYLTETYLQVVSLKPFSRTKINSRKDLKIIISCQRYPKIYFSSYNGELLGMDDENEFHYICPSLEGSKYALSPLNKKAAVYINGRLFVINYLQ